MTLSTYSIYLIYFYDSPLQRLVPFIYLENLGKDGNIKNTFKTFSYFVRENAFQRFIKSY